jgi:hypothetical protein
VPVRYRQAVTPSSSTTAPRNPRTVPAGLLDGRTGGWATLSAPSGTSSAAAAIPGTSQYAPGCRSGRGRSGSIAASRVSTIAVSATASATAATATSGLPVRPSQPTAPTTASALSVKETSNMEHTMRPRAAARDPATG